MEETRPQTRWPICLSTAPRIVLASTDTIHNLKAQEFTLDAFWSLHLFYYSPTIDIGQYSYCYSPTRLAIFPPGQKLVFHYPTDQCHHLYVHFSPAVATFNTTLPALVEMGDQQPSIEATIRHIIGIASDRPFHADAKLWNLLCDLQVMHHGLSPDQHPLIASLCYQIDQQLDRSFTIEELADTLDISPSHLSRVFRQYRQMTISQYIRQRRAAKAMHLIRYTSQTIKSIAVQVGIPDLQAFNKLIRRELGKSPRQIRETISDTSRNRLSDTSSALP